MEPLFNRADVGTRVIIKKVAGIKWDKTIGMALKFKIFEKLHGLKYGLSEKSDGAMELANGGLTNAHNRQKFFKEHGIAGKKTVSPKQCHSSNVMKVRTGDIAGSFEKADGLVTNNSNLFLTVTVADCFPVYLYNPKSSAAGLVHSGWRGTVANIAGEAVKAMDGNMADLLAGIGPGIQSCHFEIKEDVLENFLAYPEAVVHRGGKIFIDLSKIISDQLTEAGVSKKSIENCGECTFCQKDKYFSFRRDKPKNVEAMVAYIRLHKV